jgi:hypothetical protein
MAFPRTYIPGERKVTCDICGFEYRFSEMRRGVSGKQKGLIVGPACFDPVHPRDIPIKLRPKRPLPQVR